jgi:hypothetical protein
MTNEDAKKIIIVLTIAFIVIWGGITLISFML